MIIYVDYFNYNITNITHSKQQWPRYYFRVTNCEFVNGSSVTYQWVVTVTLLQTDRLQVLLHVDS